MAETSQPRVGIGVLLADNQGRVLLTLRKLPPEACCWSIVGGKVDFLETLEQCAIREARREVGVEISLHSLLCVTDHCLPGENQHWVSPAYLGQILSGEATNCEPGKTREVRWFALNQLPPNLTMTARNAHQRLLPAPWKRFLLISSKLLNIIELDYIRPLFTCACTTQLTCNNPA